MTGAHYADVDDEAAWRWVHGRIEQLPVIRLVFRFPNVKAAARKRVRRIVLDDMHEEIDISYGLIHAQQAEVRRQLDVLKDSARASAADANRNSVEAAELVDIRIELTVWEATLMAREAACATRESRLAHPSQQPPATGTQEQTP